MLFWEQEETDTTPPDETLPPGGLTQKLLYWNPTTNKWEPIGIGSGLQIVNGELVATNGIGGGIPFSAVSLLLPINTNLNDYSSNNLTITNNNVTISTTEKKWGVGSGLFSTASLTLPTNTVLSVNSDFTIELWINPTSLINRNIFLATNGATGLYINSSGKLVWWLDSVGPLLTSNTTIITNEWRYVALKRAGTTFTMHSGTSGSTVLEATATDSTVWNFSGWRIGTGQFNNPFDGYIDDFRITKGHARDTTDVPTVEFSTS